MFIRPNRATWRSLQKVVYAVSYAAVAVASIPAQATVAPRWWQLHNIVFQHLTTESGLPHPVVQALAEDGDGFIWVGTQGGLARWDGYQFRTYLPNPDDPNSLPNNVIQSLHTDRRGQLWIGTNGGGLSRYDSVHDRFTRVPSSTDGVSMRRMELVNLKLFDVDLTRHIVSVREGKGKCDRVIPIGRRACRWIDKYLLEARPQPLSGDSDALFVSNYDTKQELLDWLSKQ